MRDEFLVFGSPLIGDAEIESVVDSLRSAWIGTGPKVHRFERALETYIGASCVRCLHSCTAALMLGLRAMDIGAGDEVIVPTMTFPASANAIVLTGATPVFVDSVPGTGLLDLDATEALIGPNTKAIMPVHLAGRPVDMDRLNAIRDRHGIPIIEDAAHALGTEWRGRRIGTHGNLAAYSFYATKNITTGEGGALATEDSSLAERVERLSLHGLSAGAWQRYSDTGFKHYDVAEPGFKANMMDLQAAIGLHQLPRLDAWIDLRAEAWDQYNQLLADLPLELPPDAEPGTRHARHLYQVLVRPDTPIARDPLLDFLTRNRIGVGVHYRAVHMHPYYAERFGLTPEMFPVASDISNRTISLPLSPKVTASDQEDVAEVFRAAFSLGNRTGAVEELARPLG